MNIMRIKLTKTISDLKKNPVYLTFKNIQINRYITLILNKIKISHIIYKYIYILSLLKKLK